MVERLDAIAAYAEENQPVTVRGCCYHLFTKKLIEGMAEKYTKEISRILVKAREDELIPWDWIVVPEVVSRRRCMKAVPWTRFRARLRRRCRYLSRSRQQCQARRSSAAGWRRAEFEKPRKHSRAG